MRKFISNTFAGLIVVISSSLSACTQNDGDIGDLYGLWSLREFYADDAHLSGEECDGYFLKFQSNIVQYVKNLPYHDVQMFTGLWQIRSDSLFLNFPDIANVPASRAVEGRANDNGEVIFPIYPSLGFKVNTLTGSVLDISQTTPDGTELRYYFRKLN